MILVTPRGHISRTSKVLRLRDRPYTKGDRSHLVFRNRPCAPFVFPCERGRRSRPMPYRTDEELPDSVKNNLPAHAQDIYREAFNSAWEEYEDASKRRGNESREEVAHKVAWAA